MKLSVLKTFFLLATTIPAWIGTANAEWKEGNASDVRIKFDENKINGSYRIAVRVNESRTGVGYQADHISAGNFNNPQSIYIHGSYQTSPRFSFDDIGAFITLNFPSESFSVEKEDESGSFSSPITDVDYVVVKVSLLKTGVNRRCVVWGGMFNGNRAVYTGAYCPTSTTLSKDDIGQAIATVKMIH